MIYHDGDGSGQIRDLCAIEECYTGNIIGAEMVEIADDRFHDCFPGWTISHMVQSKNVPKLMKKDSMQIVDRSLERSAVGIEAIRRIDDHVGFAVGGFVLVL
jgi:hypothetical protein